MHKRTRQLAGLLASVAILSGCTTRLSSGLDTGASVPLSGIPYRLPVRTFVVETTWTLDGCRIDSNGEVTIPLALTAKITDQVTEGERLVIDYSRMTTSFKTGQADVSYWKIGEGKDARQTGLLKSFNGEIKGEEAEAVKAGIGAVGSLVKLGLSLGGLPVAPGSGASGTRSTELICDDDLFKQGVTPGAIGYMNKSEDRLKEIAEAFGEKTAELALIAGRTLGNLSPADEARFDALNAEVEVLKKEKKEIEKQVATLGTFYRLTQTETVTNLTGASGTPTGYVVDRLAQTTTAIVPKPEALAKLMVRALKCNPSLSFAGCNGARGSALEELKLKVSAKIAEYTVLANARLANPSNTDFKPTSTADLTAAASRGLVYREPVAARFWIELPGLPDPAPDKPFRRLAEVVAETNVNIPQIGRITVLPLKSGFAEHNGLAAEFEADGMPSKISYKAIKSGGTALLESLQAGADEATGLMAAITAAKDVRAKQAEGAELAALNSQIAVLTARNNLASLQKTPDPEAAAREADLQLLRYEKEKVELRKAIAAAQGS